MQPVHAAMSARVASSMSSSAITSETAKRPPGAGRGRPRASTSGLSPERLITQLEITTSTLASASGIVLDLPLSELDVLDPGLGWFARASVEHLVGHVEADRLAGRADAAGGDQHVDPAAGAEVENGLACAQIGDGGRVPQPSEAIVAVSGIACSPSP